MIFPDDADDLQFAFDGSFVNAERRGDLGVRVAGEFQQCDAAQRVVELAEQFFADQITFGSRQRGEALVEIEAVRRIGLQCGCRADLSRSTAFGDFAASLVASDLPGQRAEHSPQIVAIHVAVERPALCPLPQADERALHHFIGIGNEARLPRQTFASQRQHPWKESLPRCVESTRIAVPKLHELSGDRTKRLIGFVDPNG